MSWQEIIKQILIREVCNMQSIHRKTLIYKTGVEYGDYTLNHVLGCSHGCKYPCYAFQMKKRFGKVNSYEDWVEPVIVENVMELLENEIPKYKDKIKILHLCFSTDPFMYKQKEVIDVSLKIIRRLNEEKIPCSVLTKGILPQELASYSKMNEYGITIITLDEEYRKIAEPGAANIKDRIVSLKYLKEQGYKTWVSIEPFPTPNIHSQDLTDILEAVSFADKIIFGRLHYNKKVSEFKNHKEYYNQCAEKVIHFCVKNNIEYHIKKGTISERS